MKMRIMSDFELHWKISDSKTFNQCLDIAETWANNGPRPSESKTIKEMITETNPALYDKLSPQDKRCVGRAFGNKYISKSFYRLKKDPTKKCGSNTYHRF